jgi:hypothetical protein
MGHEHAMSPMFRRLWPLIPLAGMALPAMAWAGMVRGKIAGQEKLIPDVYQETLKPDAKRFVWREPSPTVRPEFRTLSANPSRDVCIAAISTQAAPKHEPIKIVVTGGHTVPTTIVISPQTMLSFENHDPFPHRIFLNGNDSFKAQDMAPGAHRDWTAPGQGRYEFRDQAFPSVRFYVVVEPGVMDVVYPGHNGAFEFKNLPEGDYYLKAFFQGKEVGQPMAVVSKKGTVELKDPLVVAEGGASK